MYSNTVFSPFSAHPSAVLLPSSASAIGGGGGSDTTNNVGGGDRSTRELSSTSTSRRGAAPTLPILPTMEELHEKEQEGITLEALARSAALLILRIGAVIRSSQLPFSAFLISRDESSNPSCDGDGNTTTTTGDGPPRHDNNSQEDKNDSTTMRKERRSGGSGTAESVRNLEMNIFAAASSPFNRLLSAPLENVCTDTDIEVWKRAVREALMITGPVYLNECVQGGGGDDDGAAFSFSSSSSPDADDDTEAKKKNKNSMVKEKREEETESKKGGRTAVSFDWSRSLLEAALDDDTLETLFGQLVLNAHAINTTLLIAHHQHQHHQLSSGGGAGDPFGVIHSEEDEEQDEEEEEPEEETVVEEVKKKVGKAVSVHVPASTTTLDKKEDDEKESLERAIWERDDKEGEKTGKSTNDGEKKNKKTINKHGKPSSSPSSHKKLKKSKQYSPSHHHQQQHQQHFSSSAPTPHSCAPSFHVVVKGAGLYSLLSSFNHSCEPNIFVTHPFETNEVQLFACRDIAAGEPLTISYIPIPPRSEEQCRWEEAILTGKAWSIEEEETEAEKKKKNRKRENFKYRLQRELSERRDMLRQYFFVCHCTRCQREERIISLL